MYYCIQLRFKILYNPGIILFFFLAIAVQQYAVLYAVYAVCSAVCSATCTWIPCPDGSFPGYVAVPRWFMIFIFIDWL